MSNPQITPGSQLFAGSVANTILDHGIAGLRPYLGVDGKSYISGMDVATNAATAIAHNAPATLRFQDWLTIDRAVIAAAVPRLRLVKDLRQRGLTFSVPDGLGKTVLLTETVSDLNPASISMEGLTKTDNDRPHFDIGNLPLPIIHKDFSFGLRQIMASRNSGTPLDLTGAELAARKVAESAEDLAIGNLANVSFAGNAIYGITNFPSRMTTTITNPTNSSWSPADTVNDVSGMLQLSRNHFHYGPWIIYASREWAQHLDKDYIINGVSGISTQTLRERLTKLEGVQDVVTLDRLDGFQLIAVQTTTDVIREVIGLDITTVQWTTEGGMNFNFKVMGILVPQIRADFNGNTGIVHGNVA